MRSKETTSRTRPNYLWALAQGSDGQANAARREFLHWAVGEQKLCRDKVRHYRELDDRAMVEKWSTRLEAADSSVAEARKLTLSAWD